MPHTPGPWHDDGYRIYAPAESHRSDKRDARVIVEYKHSDNFNFDDAPLIAAAPELLDLIKRLHDRLTDGRASIHAETIEGWAEETLEAIAKAEGS